MAIKESKLVAIIFGVTGVVGKQLAKQLLISRSKWKVYGIARKSEEVIENENANYRFISCDLLDSVETQKKLSSLDDVTHVFWVTWASQFPLDSQECCEQNRLMMANAFNAILPRAKALRHVSLQTGTKHYVSLQGPFHRKRAHKYDELCPRVGNGRNFYYVLEDFLNERLAGKVAWSVHRPGLIMGNSQRTLYNFMGSLCVYGTICKYLNLPFMFGGTKECWQEFCIDASDARLVAEQHIWAATNDKKYSTNGQAFNAINGPSFTWREIWPAIGSKFELVPPSNRSFCTFSPDSLFSENFSFSRAMSDKGQIWKGIVEQEGLIQTEMEDLANWDFLDMLFRCPVKMLGTRDKVTSLGFTIKYQALDSILYWIDVMKREKLIP